MWSYAATIINSGVGFLLLPVLTRFLDAEILALWYIFQSLGMITVLLDFGLTPSLSRNMTNAWSGAREIKKFGTTSDVGDEPNYRLMARIMGASRILFMCLAIVAFVILAVAGTPYIMHVARGVSEQSYLYAWAIFCGAVFLNVYYEYFATFLRGIGEIGLYSKIQLLSKGIQLVVTLALLLCGLGLIAPAAAFAASGFSLRFLSKRGFDRRVGVESHAELRERPHFSAAWDTFKILWPNSWRDGLVSVADYLTTQGTTIVCSLFLSLSDAGIYAISMQLLNVIHTGSAVYCNAKKPAVQNAYVARDERRLISGVGVSMVLYGMLFCLGIVGVAFVIAPLLTMLNPTYVFDTPSLFLLGIYLYVIGRFKLYAGFIAMTNDLSYYRAFIVSGFVALVAAAGSLEVFGSSIFAFIVPQLGVQCAYNAWKWPKYFQQLIGVSEREVIAAGFKGVRSVIRH